MATSLPSAVIWYGQVPISDPGYDFKRRDELPRILSIPDKYDRLMLDVGRMRTGSYCIEFLRDYERRQRWPTMFSIREAVDMALAAGKKPIMYLGGWHEQNIPAWEEYSRRGQLEEVLRQILRIFDGPDGYVCDFAFDGTGRNGVTWNHIITRSVAFVQGRGAGALIEGAAFPPSVLAGLPSVTTAASAVNRTPPAGREHAIAMTNSVGLDRIPGWRREGRTVFIPAHDIKSDGSLPAWWGGTLEGAA